MNVSVALERRMKVGRWWTSELWCRVSAHVSRGRIQWWRERLREE